MAHNGASEDIRLKDVLKATKALSWEEAVVKLGYGDLFGLEKGFDFRIRLSRPQQISHLLSLVGSYNNYDGEMLGPILAQLMADSVLMYIEFGRAGSPELFIYMYRPEENRSRIEALARTWEADEIGEWGPYGIRLWWD